MKKLAMAKLASVASWFKFELNWLVASILRLVALLTNQSLDVAFISTFRDFHDVRNFGFSDPEKLPNFFKWACYSWLGLRGALYMIGSTTNHVAGREIDSSSPSFQRGRRQFIAATEEAVSRGAKIILLAAATKRLFKVGELESIFPGVIFTLGDNFTGLLLLKRVAEAARLHGLNLKKSRILIIGPYGMLGSVATFALTAVGCQVVGLGNPKRKDLLEKFSKMFGIVPVYSYEEVGKVDIVIACNSSDAVVLTPSRVEKIRKPGKKLVVIDPSEPYGMSEENFVGCDGSVVRFDAGNGYSSKLRYVPFPFGNLMWRLLRMNEGVTWGCFCETFILAKHIQENPKLKDVDWFDISRENIAKILEFYGEADDQFTLPEPTCFNKRFEDFSLEFDEKNSSKKKKKLGTLFSSTEKVTLEILKIREV